MSDTRIKDNLDNAEALLELAKPAYGASYEGKGAISELCVTVAYLLDAVRLLAARHESSTSGMRVAFPLAPVEMVDAPATCAACHATFESPTTGKVMSPCHCGGRLLPGRYSISSGT